MNEQPRWVDLAVCVLIGLPTLFALSPFVFSKLWGWHVVPLGAPPIGFWRAWGLLIVVSYPLLGIFHRLPPLPEPKTAWALYKTTFGPHALILVSLFSGWVIS